MVLQLIILYSIVLLLIIIMATGKIGLYIHPRLNKGIWFSIVVMILMVVFKVPSIRKARHNIPYWPYLIIIFPIITGFSLPAVAVKNSVVVGQQLSNTKPAQDSSVTPVSETMPEESQITTEQQVVEESSLKESLSENEVMVEPEVDIKQKYEQLQIEGVTAITDERFIQWNVDVYNQMELLKGQRVSFLAQVYHIDGLADNQILCGRLLMICCAADAGLYGVLANTQQASSLEEESWVNVTGTLDITDFQGEKTPILIEVKIEKAQQPEDIYVYDYGN